MSIRLFGPGVIEETKRTLRGLSEIGGQHFARICYHAIKVLAFFALDARNSAINDEDG
jgi:hypothetical protein